MLEILIIVILGIPFGLLLFFIPNKLGYNKAAKVLIKGFGILMLAFILFAAFEDYLFTKSNAKELVQEQNLILNEDFKITKNFSTSAIGDYYHSFTLEISEGDKLNAILKIKESNNFKSKKETANLIGNRYFGPKMTQNYETDKTYVREYFEPSGQEGYAPTFRRISISKTKNELTFEDIDE